MTLPLILGFAGLMFLWGAVKNVTPWSEIQQAFGGAGTPNPGTPPPDPPAGGVPPPPPPPGGGSGNVTQRCQTFMDAVVAQFPGIHFGGAYVCKCIKDTCTPSQHSWGNAVDYMPTEGGEFDNFVRWVSANKVRFGIEHFLIHEPFGTWTHTDFAPNFHGDPPCFAGGRPSSCVGCG